MNGRLRHQGKPTGMRLRAIAAAKREGHSLNFGPGVACIGTPLGEQLGIAALYAGRGEQAEAVSSALLAIAGVADTPEHRAAVIRSVASITGAVRAAVAAGGLH